MKCPKILSKFGRIKDHIKYEHVYGNIQEQKEVAPLFLQILRISEELLEEQDNVDPDDKDQDDQEDAENDIISLPVAFNWTQCRHVQREINIYMRQDIPQIFSREIC